QGYARQSITHFKAGTDSNVGRSQHAVPESGMIELPTLERNQDVEKQSSPIEEASWRLEAETIERILRTAEDESSFADAQPGQSFVFAESGDGGLIELAAAALPARPSHDDG